MQGYRVPLQLFIDGSLLTSVVGFDGTLYHMSPELLRVLGVESGRIDDVPERNIVRLIPNGRGRERLAYVRRAISNAKPIVLRSVVSGVQFVSHMMPLPDEKTFPQAVALLLHVRTEGVLDRESFATSDYAEADFNDFGILANLTKREAEVLALLASGADGPEIADRLHRSTETVSSHQKSLYAKLKCASRMQAMMIARRAGLSLRDVPRIASPRVDND
jgi:DNA-binding NarL/FixJ family response regulator